MSFEITRELLQTAPVEGMPGWETRLSLITYPSGADGSGHSHPVRGLGYVLEGTMVSAFDDDAEEIIVAGQGFQDKASFHRVVRNGSATEPMRSMRCKAVSRDPGLTLNTPRETCSTRRAMPNPCIGSRFRVFRTSMSRVP